MRILKQNELIRCRIFCLQFAIPKYKHYNILYMETSFCLLLYIGRQYRMGLFENRVLRGQQGLRGRE